MARTARVKRNGKGITHYHLMSRANDRRFLFDGAKVKDKIVDSLRRAAEFSGVRPRAYTTLDNHFHIVVTVDRTGGSVPGGGAGSVPERWVMKRVPQMTAGKVFGSFEFVGGTAAALGDRFGAKFVGAHPVGEMGYSTHGWKLAREVA